MFRKRGVSCALLIGLGVSLVGCAPQPTVYSGAYYGPHGPVYNGLYYVGTGPGAWGAFGGYPAWRPGYASTLPFFNGPYYGGYYWRNGRPYGHRAYHYHRHYFRGAY